MDVRVHDRVAFPALDIIVEAWLEKSFPYNNTKAVVPQRLIPQELVADKRALANFLFAVCYYMKGRITSEAAFKGMLKIWRKHPEMFEPSIVSFWSTDEIEGILAEFINRDIVQTAKAWKENARRLVDVWGGEAFNITKGLKSHKEAMRRIKNKRTKRDLKRALRANGTGEGFEGFQDKMVSMLIYFFDWFGLLEVRFLYPAPADFHNLRLGFATGSITVFPVPERLRYSTKLAALWGVMLMRYMKQRNYDPIDVADALWLFSALMCGRSPLTTLITAKEWKPTERHLFNNKHVRGKLMISHPDFMSKNSRGFVDALGKTCLRCPFFPGCKYTIPAGPYYQNTKGPDGQRLGGQIYLVPRPPIEQRFAPIVKKAEDTQTENQLRLGL